MRQVYLCSTFHTHRGNGLELNVLRGVFDWLWNSRTISTDASIWPTWATETISKKTDYFCNVIMVILNVHHWVKFRLIRTGWVLKKHLKKQFFMAEYSEWIEESSSQRKEAALWSDGTAQVKCTHTTNTNVSLIITIQQWVHNPSKQIAAALQQRLKIWNNRMLWLYFVACGTVHFVVLEQWPHLHVKS